jgi:hypothetical protein
MTEAYEAVLRKSLDAVDRRQKWMKNIAVVLIVLACAISAPAMMSLADMRLLYIATFLGMTLWTGGLAVAILGVSNRNTQLTLRSIALLSESAAQKEPAHTPSGTSDNRER